MNILSKFMLDNKVAVVTGGSRGLGKAMAIGFAEAGANVVISALHINKAKITAREIEKLGVKAIAKEVDVTDEDEVNKLVHDVVNEFGKIDILLNNAGICIDSHAEEMTKKQWDDVINVNLNGVFLCSKAFGKEMIKNKKGSIINICSISGYIVNYPQRQIAYNTSKAAVIHLTKSLAAEWAKYNIRVNGIAPGYMRTEMTKKSIDPQDIKKYFVAPTPMKRIGEPEELQGAAVYLASEASSFMTGNILIIDGGYTIY